MMTMNRKNLISYFLSATVILTGWMFSAGSAEACLYQGSNCYDGLETCTATCKQFGCTAGVEEPVPLNGCAGAGFTCCRSKKDAPVIPPPSSDCIGSCVSPDFCKPNMADGKNIKGDGAGVCEGTLVCCRETMDNKTTVTPDGGNAGSQTNMTQGTPDAYKSFSDTDCSAGGFSFPCPLGPSSTIPSRIGNLLSMVLGLVGALFFAMFVWGGVLYLTAGTSKRTQEGTQTLVNAVIGLIIVAFSYVIVERVISWLGSAGV